MLPTVASYAGSGCNAEQLDQFGSDSPPPWSARLRNGRAWPLGIGAKGMMHTAVASAKRLRGRRRALSIERMGSEISWIKRPPPRPLSEVKC